MTDALRRSFSVTFPDLGDPAAAECLRRLDELAETLVRLADVGLCSFEATSQEVVRGGIVSHALVLQFFKARGKGTDPTRTAGRVMEGLFELWREAPDIRVRFFCWEYKHLQGMCECGRLVWNRTGATIVYKSLGDKLMASRWVMSRADLLMLTDEQLAVVPCHPNTRENIIDFIAWLRANPNAE
jgi:hypothetical protein